MHSRNALLAAVLLTICLKHAIASVCTPIHLEQPVDALNCTALGIRIDKLIYADREKVSFNPYEPGWDWCEYWIEDTGGQVMKAKVNTSSSSARSWTPDIGPGNQAFIIRSICHRDGCEPESSERLIAVRGESAHLNSSSSISIDDVTYSSEELLVTLAVYRGDTQKSSVQISVIGEKGVLGGTRVTMAARREWLHARIPLRVHGCGEATVAAVGLDTQDNRTVQLGPCTAENGSRDELIRSFYTLAKLYKESITLYATLSDFEGDVRLVVESPAGRVEKEAVPGKNSIITPAQPGENEFILYAMSGEEMLAQKTLSVELEDRTSELDGAETDGDERDSGKMTSAVVREGSGDSNPYVLAGAGLAAGALAVAGYLWLRKPDEPTS
jgi:hypothetical protein